MRRRRHMGFSSLIFQRPSWRTTCTLSSPGALVVCWLVVRSAVNCTKRHERRVVGVGELLHADVEHARRLAQLLLRGRPADRLLEDPQVLRGEGAGRLRLRGVHRVVELGVVVGEDLLDPLPGLADHLGRAADVDDRRVRDRALRPRLAALPEGEAGEDEADHDDGGQDALQRPRLRPRAAGTGRRGPRTADGAATPPSSSGRTPGGAARAPAGRAARSRSGSRCRDDRPRPGSWRAATGAPSRRAPGARPRPGASSASSAAPPGAVVGGGGRRGRRGGSGRRRAVRVGGRSSRPSGPRLGRSVDSGAGVGDVGTASDGVLLVGLAVERHPTDGSTRR